MTINKDSGIIAKACCSGQGLTIANLKDLIWNLIIISAISILSNSKSDIIDNVSRFTVGRPQRGNNYILLLAAGGLQNGDPFEFVGHVVSHCVSRFGVAERGGNVLADKERLARRILSKKNPRPESR